MVDSILTVTYFARAEYEYVEMMSAPACKTQVPYMLNELTVEWQVRTCAGLFRLLSVKCEGISQRAMSGLAQCGLLRQTGVRSYGSLGRERVVSVILRYSTCLVLATSFCCGESRQTALQGHGIGTEPINRTSYNATSAPYSERSRTGTLTRQESLLWLSATTIRSPCSEVPCSKELIGR